MAFQISNGGGGRFTPMSEINVTPMVDVMLVLLVIFMVTAPMMMQGLDVDLPKADAKAINSREEELVLTLTKDGRYMLGKAEIPRDRLEDAIATNAKLKADKKILLHADKELEYGEVVRVMAALKNAGVDNVGMVTDPISRGGFGLPAGFAFASELF
jgi:biopolymer transport protein TolR